MEGIDESLYFYEIPSTEVLKNRKEFHRLEKEYDEPIQAWQGRVQSHMNRCEFPVIVSSEFHSIDKFMCELDVKQIASIRNAGDTWSFEQLHEHFANQKIGADQLNDDNSSVIGKSVERNLEIPTADIKSELDDPDEYPHIENDMNSGMMDEDDYLDDIKSEYTDEVDFSFLIPPKDVANGNMKTETEESDSNAIDEMLIEGMQCEPGEYKFSLGDPVDESDIGNNRSKDKVETKPNGKNHIKRQTSGSVHTCSICKKSFNQLGHLNIHKRSVHERIRPFSCDLCKKSFKQLGHLNIHKQSVHERIRHTCNLCGRLFTQLCSLNLHKQSDHEGIRHTCSICKKSFNQLGHLNIHKRSVHEGIRPFSCDICEKLFTQLSNLKKHRRSIHSSVIK